MNLHTFTEEDHYCWTKKESVIEFNRLAKFHSLCKFVYTEELKAMSGGEEL